MDESQTNITVVTQAAGNIDPRQMGVRPLGSYWGGESSGYADAKTGEFTENLPALCQLFVVKT